VLQDDLANASEDLYIRSVAFSPDGAYLATGAEDNIIRVWDIAHNDIKLKLLGHEQDIYSIDWSRDGKYIVSGSGDRTVKVS
jgi:glucose repression regulatory protein TUP1